MTTEQHKDSAQSHVREACRKITGPAKGRITDFLDRYHAVFQLHQMAETRPQRITGECLAALEHLLIRFDGYRQRQRFFLFREAAQTLTEIMQHHPDGAYKDTATAILKLTLYQTTGPAHRAAAEALGALPAPLSSHHRPPRRLPKIVTYRWRDLLQALGLQADTVFDLKGRSLVAPLQQSSETQLAIIKLACRQSDLTSLFTEAQWIHRVARNEELRHTLGTGSGVSPILPGNLPYLVQIHGFPQTQLTGCELWQPVTALCFKAPGDYYQYPNAPETVQRTGPDQWTGWLTRAAKRLARLLRQGLFHDAPIPLFHNRTQSHRRDDAGLYQWYRAGRLDQWLESCAYPNFSLSGLRDLEHLAPISSGGLRLYRAMGTHLLSLFLVCGSCFRNRQPHRKGIDEQGQPLDQRHLFDHQRLSSMVQAVGNAYYSGFVGGRKEEAWPLDFDHLARRMIDEMGVDRHMTEILRVHDQDAMDRSMFEAFLRSRGYDEHAIRRTPKGEADITLVNGPHLGDFNRTISLPEVIEAVGALAGICVADGYGRNKAAHGRYGSF